MTARQATEIRNHLKAQGYDVRIGRDGRVTYRKDDGAWLEGRWVSEYRTETLSDGADRSYLTVRLT